MSALSDARISAARKAIVDANGDLATAHISAEKYYSEYIGRLPTMNEIHDLADLVEKFVKAENKKAVDAGKAL